MEDKNGMTVRLNQRNAIFVGRKGILRKFADRKVLEIIEKPT